MDIARPDLKRQKRRRQVLLLLVVILVVVAATVGVSRLKPAAPSVEWGALWPDTVKQMCIRDSSGILLDHVQRRGVRLFLELPQCGNQGQGEHRAQDCDQQPDRKKGAHGVAFRKRSVLSQ